MTAIAHAMVMTLPGVPMQPTLNNVTSALLGPMLSCKPSVDDGPKLTPQSGLGPLHRMLDERPSFTARGTNKFEARFKWLEPIGVSPTGTGSLHLHIEQTAIDADTLIETLVSAVSLTGGPMAYIDIMNGDAFSVRRERHRERFQEGKTGRDGIFGYVRGFTGIAWRTILGPDSIAFFGEHNLKALPSELATKTSEGSWILSPCAEPHEWTAAQWIPGEAEIVKTLGPECFFDPVSGRLPERTPTIPEVARIPARGRRRTAQGDWVWETHNDHTVGP